MKSATFLLAALAAVISMSSSAEARDYPWCAVRQAAPQYGDCSSVSFAQCKAAVTFSETCIANALAAPERPRQKAR